MVIRRPRAHPLDQSLPKMCPLPSVIQIKGMLPGVAPKELSVRKKVGAPGGPCSARCSLQKQDRARCWRAEAGAGTLWSW